MSPSNPSFVRLADHMVHGMVVDMETGWSLSGYDVQPFPEDKDQAKFVRQKINASIIEPASQSEYDAAHPADESDDEKAQEAAQLVELVKAAAGRGGGSQEHVLRAKHAGSHAEIQRQRQLARLREAGVDVDDDEADLDFAEDQARREAAAAEAEENDETNDDPEAQKERTATRAQKKAKK